MTPPKTDSDGWFEWRGMVTQRLCALERDMGTLRKLGVWLVLFLAGLFLATVYNLTCSVDPSTAKRIPIYLRPAPTGSATPGLPVDPGTGD